MDNPQFFYPDGDVVLDLSPSLEAPDCFLRVSSHVLSLASPVFATMLGPNSNSREANTLRFTGKALIKLPGEDEEALTIVMNAAHLRGQRIPSKISVDLFYRIALLCNKYDMAQTMLPWPVLWTNNLLPLRNHEGYERLLVAGWIFRLQHVFGLVTAELVRMKKPGIDQFEERDLGQIIPEAVFGLYSGLAARMVLRREESDALQALHDTTMDSVIDTIQIYLGGFTVTTARRRAATTHDLADQDSKELGPLLRFLAGNGLHGTPKRRNTASALEINNRIVAAAEEGGIDCSLLGDVAADVGGLFMDENSGLMLADFRTVYLAD